MLRADLAAAGIAYRDGSDQVADFHDLRHTFITMLARSGAATGPARYAVFRARRERWWLERLGPAEFWRRRLAWAVARGRHGAAARAAAELVKARVSAL